MFFQRLHSYIPSHQYIHGPFPYQKSLWNKNDEESDHGEQQYPDNPRGKDIYSDDTDYCPYDRLQNHNQCICVCF